MIQKWMEICESEKIAAIKLIWKFEKKKTEAEMKNWKAAHVYMSTGYSCWIQGSGFMLKLNPPIKISVTSAI